MQVDGAAARVEITVWPADATQRIVLGDRTATLTVAALPDPASDRGAVRALVAAVREHVSSVPGLRTQLFLRWPSADLDMHPLLEQAGLAVDALWSSAAPSDVRTSPQTAVSVRPAAASDGPAIGDLAEEEVRFHLPLTPFTRMVASARTVPEFLAAHPDPTRPLLVAERAGEIVGYALCRIASEASGPSSGHFTSVGVSEHSRGTGVGSSLVRAGVDLFARRGAVSVSAAFVPGNPLASAFWRGRGLHPVWHYYAAVHS